MDLILSNLPEAKVVGELQYNCNAYFHLSKEMVWVHHPVVSLDVMSKEKAWVRHAVISMDGMYHLSDPNIVLMLLCFGVCCVTFSFGRIFIRTIRQISSC